MQRRAGTRSARQRSFGHDARGFGPAHREKQSADPESRERIVHETNGHDVRPLNVIEDEQHRPGAHSAPSHLSMPRRSGRSSTPLRATRARARSRRRSQKPRDPTDLTVEEGVVDATVEFLPSNLGESSTSISAARRKTADAAERSKPRRSHGVQHPRIRASTWHNRDFPMPGVSSPAPRKGKIGFRGALG
jgi:hypothetical protein